MAKTYSTLSDTILNYIREFFVGVDLRCEIYVRPQDFRQVLSLVIRKNDKTNSYRRVELDYEELFDTILFETLPYKQCEYEKTNIIVGSAIISAHLMNEDYLDFQVDALKLELKRLIQKNRKEHFTKLLKDFDDYETLVFGAQRSLLTSFKERNEKQRTYQGAYY